MTYSEFPDSVRRASEPAAEPSIGELALEDRSALRRVAGLSTELADVSEVEYRQLRLERVVLVGVWTEGTAADNQASLAELAALAETTGSQVLEGLSNVVTGPTRPPTSARARPPNYAKWWWRPGPTPSSVMANCHRPS